MCPWGSRQLRRSWPKLLQTDRQVSRHLLCFQIAHMPLPGQPYESRQAGVVWETTLLTMLKYHWPTANRSESQVDLALELSAYICAFSSRQALHVCLKKHVAKTTPGQLSLEGNKGAECA